MDHLSLQVLLLPSFSPSSLLVVAKIQRVLSMRFYISLDQWCTNPAHNHTLMSKLCGDAKCLWFLNAKCVSCYPSGT